MDEKIYREYVAILKEELQPAMGCAEGGAGGGKVQGSAAAEVSAQPQIRRAQAGGQASGRERRAQPPKPAEGAAPNGEKRADGHRRRHRGGRGRNKSTTPGNAAPSTPAAE